MIWPGHWAGRIVAIGIVMTAAVVVLGGGGTYVAMSVTTEPEFCATCHIMEPYVESWRTSSHSMVPCVDCHYEPGLLETYEGKFKALSQLAKYVTSTQGTKPWAEVSDYSCMRSGCHSNRLLEGEIPFGRIRFDHRHHLIDLKRGKRLRCTSCHGQIVQGEGHLTVTTTTCILCHFHPGADDPGMSDCYTCHGPPTAEIDLGGFVFRHQEYLDRGVDCVDCHGDVTRGTGDVPRSRCGSCHNKQEHLERYEDVEFVHRHHVSEHSVSCLECHTEIEHGLTSREEHYAGACTDCHVGPHQVPRAMFRGEGGLDVPDDPSVMARARVTCNGCHRPPFRGAPTPPPGTTWTADPLACIDCHGPGFAGMVDRWQAEIRTTTAQVKSAVEIVEKRLQGAADAPPAGAEARYRRAAHNLGLVLLDRSDGAHNLPYVRALLAKAATDLSEAARLLDEQLELPRMVVGPYASSEQECTTLCHTGIETAEITRYGRYGFSHTPHLLRAGLDCSDCHADEPHGALVIEPATCVDCHHEEAVDEENCGDCHLAVVALREADVSEDDEASMLGLDCIACHEGLADGHSPSAIEEACTDCHDDEPLDFVAWRGRGATDLERVERLLGDRKDAVAREIRRLLAEIRVTGPYHHAAAARQMAAEWARRLEESAEAR